MAKVLNVLVCPIIVLFVNVPKYVYIQLILYKTTFIFYFRIRVTLEVHTRNVELNVMVIVIVHQAVQHATMEYVKIHVKVHAAYGPIVIYED